MSHFPVAVVLPSVFAGGLPYTEGDILGEVVRLLAPFDENDEFFREGSRWDWWVVGGRWDGGILGKEWLGLKEQCRQCQGTGERPGGLEEFGQKWYDWCKGCNGCQGTGEQEVWATDNRYTTLDRNRCLVKEVPTSYIMSAFVHPDGLWYEKGRMGWFGIEMDDEEGQSPESKVAVFDQAWSEVRSGLGDNIVVGLDCHV